MDESSAPSQTISETSLSSVRVVVFPVFRSIKSHQDLVLWVSKEYCDTENRAVFYDLLASSHFKSFTYSRRVRNSLSSSWSADHLPRIVRTCYIVRKVKYSLWSHGQSGRRRSDKREPTSCSHIEHRNQLRQSPLADQIHSRCQPIYTSNLAEKPASPRNPQVPSWRISAGPA